MSLVSPKEAKIQYLTIHSIRRILAALRKAEEFRARVSVEYSSQLAKVLKNPEFNEDLIKLIDITAFALSPITLENDKVRQDLNNLLAQVVHDYMRFKHFNPSESKFKGEEKVAVMGAVTKSWQLMTMAYGLNPLAFYLEMLLKRYHVKSREAMKLLEAIRKRGEG